MVLQDTNKLEIELNKVIQKEFDNTELKREMNGEFLKKGLSPKTITMLFDGKKFINQLNEFELIAFTKSCYKHFNNTTYNPEKYFSSMTLEGYRNYIFVNEEIDIIKLHNFIEVDDTEYQGIISYRQIYELMNNGLLLYDMNCQREATYKKLGKDNWIKTPTVDSKAVANMEQLILDGKLETSQIVLTLLIDEEVTPKFDFQRTYENIGNIVCQSLTVNDGFHRCIAITKATASNLVKNDKYIDGYIGVRLIIADLQRAKSIMAQSFMRSDISTDFKKAITEDDKSNFLDKIINNSDTLKDEVGITYEEAKTLNKKTYRSLLLDIMKYMDIDYSNKSEVIIKSKKIAEQFDILNGFIETNNMNIYAILLYCAYKVAESNKKDDISIYYKLEEEIYNIIEHSTKYNLNHKTIKLTKIIQYINNVFKEEI